MIRIGATQEHHSAIFAPPRRGMNKRLHSLIVDRCGWMQALKAQISDRYKSSSGESHSNTTKTVLDAMGFRQ